MELLKNDTIWGCVLDTEPFHSGSGSQFSASAESDPVFFKFNLWYLKDNLGVSSIFLCVHRSKNEIHKPTCTFRLKIVNKKYVFNNNWYFLWSQFPSNLFEMHKCYKLAFYEVFPYFTLRLSNQNDFFKQKFSISGRHINTFFSLVSTSWNLTLHAL
jgi:hypothetical protein